MHHHITLEHLWSVEIKRRPGTRAAAEAPATGWPGAVRSGGVVRDAAPRPCRRFDAGPHRAEGPA
jgi:hypothetical protein